MADTFEMYGPQSNGFRLAEKDNSAQILNQLAQMKGMGELAMMPAEMRLKEAHARYYGAEADDKIETAGARRRLASAMQDLQTSGQLAEDPADQLDQVAGVARSAGDIKRAGDLFAQSALIRSRRARQTEQEAQADKLRTEIGDRDFKVAAQIFGSAHDQPSLDRALLMAQGRGINVQGIPRDYASAAPLVRQLAEASLTEAERERIALRQREVVRGDTTARDESSTRAQLRQLRNVQIQEAEERLQKLKKNGGDKPLAAPNANEQTQATAFIRQQLGDASAAPLDLRVASSDLAGEAKRLMRQNPALTFSQGLAQAYQVQSKDWTTTGGKGFTSKTAKFSSLGRSSATPRPLPDSKNTADLTTGWYTDGKGSRYWTGKGWADKGPE